MIPLSFMGNVRSLLESIGGSARDTATSVLWNWLERFGPYLLVALILYMVVMGAVNQGIQALAKIPFKYWIGAGITLSCASMGYRTYKSWNSPPPPTVVEVVKADPRLKELQSELQAARDREKAIIRKHEEGEAARDARERAERDAREDERKQEQLAEIQRQYQEDMSKAREELTAGTQEFFELQRRLKDAQAKLRSRVPMSKFGVEKYRKIVAETTKEMQAVDQQNRQLQAYLRGGLSPAIVTPQEMKRDRQTGRVPVGSFPQSRIPPDRAKAAQPQARRSGWPQR